MKKLTVLALAFAVMIAGPAAFADSDLNVTHAGKGTLEPPIFADVANATCTFPGPATSFAINLTIVNNAPVDIDAWGIDGASANDGHIIWDTFGAFSGPATLTSTTGIDTERVIAFFSGFSPGESVTFSGIDPDILGNPSFGVTVGGIANSRTGARGHGQTFYSTFVSDGVNTYAIIGPSASAAGGDFAGLMRDLSPAKTFDSPETESFGAVKSLFR
ncbi:MAG: hypothetical protein AB7V45_04770 [Candidatus Krumholzibacteriia bacterium]